MVCKQRVQIRSFIFSVNLDTEIILAEILGHLVIRVKRVGMILHSGLVNQVILPRLVQFRICLLYTSSDISIQELASAFMVLFAVIDITGAVPIINDIQNNGRKISAIKAALASYILLVAFLFAGDGLLNLFNVDISSFAVAGSLVIFVLALEMIFGIPIFKNDGPSGTASIVPLVFPLIVGAGTLPTLLALRAEYHTCLLYTSRCV